MLVPNSIPTPARPPILRTRLAWLLLLAAIPLFAAKPDAPLRLPAERCLAALILSPDAHLLIIETIRRMPPTPRPKPPILGPTPAPSPQLTERDPVQINFYRIHAGDDGGPVQVRSAGAIQTP